MPTFTPPAIPERPPTLPSDRGPTERLFRYYRPRVRGVNVYKMSDNTYIDNANGAEPYPARVDAVTTFPNGALAQSWYNGTMTNYPLPLPTVLTIYFGGHTHQITSAEAALLTAAGYGAGIS